MELWIVYLSVNGEVTTTYWRGEAEAKYHADCLREQHGLVSVGDSTWYIEDEDLQVELSIFTVHTED